MLPICTCFALFLCRCFFYSVSSCVLLVLLLFGLIRLKRRSSLHFLNKLPGYFEDIPLVKAIGIFRYLQNSAKESGIAVGVYHLQYYKSLFFSNKHRDGGIWVDYIGGQPMLYIFKAKEMEQVLTHSTNISKGMSYTFLIPWLGKSLLISTGNRWRTQRKMLTPSFHFRILDDFGKVMNQHAKIFVDRLAAKPSCDDIMPYISALTLDIVCETIMGTAMNCQSSDYGKQYLEGVSHLGDLTLSRLSNPMVWSDNIYRFTKSYEVMKSSLKVVHDFTLKVIEERKRELLENPELLSNVNVQDGDEIVIKSKKPFLDLMLQKHLNGELTVEDMRGQVDTFMFAGHDTTSMALTYAIYLIGLYPEVQKKLHKEIDEVFGQEECEVTGDHVRSLKYMDMVIKESQRVYPSVPAVERILDEDMIIGDTLVPKGTGLSLTFIFLHQDETVFPKPDEFIPERFCPEQSANRSPFAFVPFSAGPRNCIGQKFALLEEKIILCWLLRRFKWASLDSRDKLELATELVIRPKNKIRVQFQRRT